LLVSPSYRFRHPAGGNFDIYLVEADSATPLRLTTDPAEDFAPSWAPAGEAIYFGSSRSGEWQMWRFDLDDENPGVQRGWPRATVVLRRSVPLLRQSGSPGVVAGRLDGQPTVRDVRDRGYRTGGLEQLARTDRPIKVGKKGS